jgi:2-dehydropantoate 2-reductase
MRVLVVGAGATGGYFGARLAQAGRDVTFLVRERRAEALRQEGLRVVSPFGDFEVAPTVVTKEEIGGAYDVVLMTVKSFALDAAMADAAAAVGSETMILPVLNGMKHLDLLAARFGPGAVIGGAIKIPATMDAQGRVVQLAKMHTMTFGELSGESTARILALASVLADAGFEARLSDNILLEMWEKWVLLASLGGINALMRGTIGQVRAAAGGEAFALAFIDECAAVAGAYGFAPRAEFLAGARAQLTEVGSPATSSMYRDLCAGLPVEAEQILGDLFFRGAAKGLATPLLAAAWTNLDVYQKGLGT